MSNAIQSATEAVARFGAVLERIDKILYPPNGSQSWRRSA